MFHNQTLNTLVCTYDAHSDFIAKAPMCAVSVTTSHCKQLVESKHHIEG